MALMSPTWPQPIFVALVLAGCAPHDEPQSEEIRRPSVTIPEEVRRPSVTIPVEVYSKATGPNQAELSIHTRPGAEIRLRQATRTLWMRIYPQPTRADENGLALVRIIVIPGTWVLGVEVTDGIDSGSARTRVTVEGDLECHDRTLWQGFPRCVKRWKTQEDREQ